MVWWYAAAAGAVVAIAAFVLGVRLGLGCDDLAMRALFRLIKPDHGPVGGEPPGRQLPQWAAVVCFWVVLPVLVPTVVLFHLLVLLPLFAGGHLAGWATGWRHAEPGAAADTRRRSGSL